MTAALDGTTTSIAGSLASPLITIARWLLISAAAGCVEQSRASASMAQSSAFRFMGLSSYKEAARSGCTARPGVMEL